MGARFALVILLLVAAALPVGAQDAALTADQIVDRALATESLGFRSGEATMRLIVQDASGESRERQLTIRAMNENDQSRALVRVLAPAEVAGQSYLFRENAGGEDDVYVFLPALDDAPRRISGSQKNGAFMGTHFTYADLETRDIAAASYSRQPDETIGEFPVFVIDAIPDDLAGSDYARVRLWIRQSDFIPLRVRFFGESGETLKTLFTEQVDEADGRTYVRRMSLRPAEGGGTTMILEAVDFDADVAPGEFTQQALVN